MGLYNTLRTPLKCPNCGISTVHDVEFKFGSLDLKIYFLGDKLVWNGVRKSIPTKPPAMDIWCGEGYSWCECCEIDLWLMVVVEKDILKSLLINILKTKVSN